PRVFAVASASGPRGRRPESPRGRGRGAQEGRPGRGGTVRVGVKRCQGGWRAGTVDGSGPLPYAAVEVHDGPYTVPHRSRPDRRELPAGDPQRRPPSARADLRGRGSRPGTSE